MNFTSISFSLILILGTLNVFFITDLQIINPQPDSLSSSSSSSTTNLQNISVKITSPLEGKQVPPGKLTVSGISSDNQHKNCIVFVDWNDLKPFQPVRPAGPGGIGDYSKWIFTFDSSYHEIVEGENELTSKITCIDRTKPLTKWNSINITGSGTESISLTNFQSPLRGWIPQQTARSVQRACP